MFSPLFTINNKILKNIGAIEAAKAIIDEAPLIPVYEKQFQQEAIIRTVHFGTRIEGNDLTYQEVQKNWSKVTTLPVLIVTSKKSLTIVT